MSSSLDLEITCLFPSTLSGRLSSPGTSLSDLDDLLLLLIDIFLVTVMTLIYYFR